MAEGGTKNNNAFLIVFLFVFLLTLTLNIMLSGIAAICAYCKCRFWYWCHIVSQVINRVMNFCCSWGDLIHLKDDHVKEI